VGSVKTTWIPVTVLPSGAELRLAVHELSGRREGPTVGLVGAVHGDEPIGTAIVLRAVRELDGQLEAGRILALPVANPLALEALTRNTPYDQLNLNRVFPGAREGLVTEQLAYVISQQVIPQCAIIVDFHAAGHHGAVDYVIAGNDEALGLAFGRRHIYVGPSFSGTLTGFAAQRGVRTITPELGGVAMDDPEALAGGMAGIRNVLCSLGMIRGSVQAPPEQIVFTRKRVLKPVHGGVLYPALGPADLGREVPEGTLLATVASPMTGEPVEEIRASFSRSLVIHVRTVAGPIVPGMYAYQVADLEDARVIRH
jgi:predicted deacylase